MNNEKIISVTYNVLIRLLGVSYENGKRVLSTVDRYYVDFPQDVREFIDTHEKKRKEGSALFVWEEEK